MDNNIENGSVEWTLTPAMKQFAATVDLAREETKEAEAAKVFKDSIIPMFVTAGDENHEGMEYYNGEQMIVSFIAGQQWLRDRIARRIPKACTIETAFDLLREFLFAIPREWTIKQAVEYLKKAQ